MNNFEEIYNNITSRRSIRKFNDKEITDEVFLKLVEAGSWAPSGCKAEPWFFYIIKSKEMIEEMRSAVIAASTQSEFCKLYRTFHNAPYIISVCVNTEKRWYHRPSDQKILGVEAIDNPDYFSVAGAIQNLLLVAHSLNIGTCWAGVTDDYRIQLEKVIGIDDKHMLAANIAIGYYDEIPPTPHRKPAEDIIKFMN